jgi:DNA-binding CsgD family transcriptional regulator
LTPQETLIGRDAELNVLRGFLAQAFSDGSAMLFVGEAGIGKTSMLEAAVDLATARGGSILHVTGVEFEADLAFAGLHQLLVPLADEFAALDPDSRKVLDDALGFDAAGPIDRLRVSNATLKLLRGTAASRAGLLIVIDDLQWLDRQSIDVLGFVSRRLHRGRLGILMAARPEAAEDLRDIVPATELLGPLDDGAAAELIRSRHPNLGDGTRTRLLGEAAGNPLALLELPSAAGEDPHPAELPTIAPLQTRLQAVFAHRIRQVPESARRLLLLAALDPTGDPRILGASEIGDEGGTALAAAEEAQLVEIDAGSQRINFPHPLIRSAVVGDATPTERRWAHRWLGEHFAEHPDRRAWHLAAAVIGHDEEVAELLEEAARRYFRRGEPGAAIAAWTRASSLTPDPAVAARRLAEAAYVKADVTGDLAGSEELLAQARRLGDVEPPSLPAAIVAAHAILNGDGNFDHAHRLLVEALEDASDTDSIASSPAEALYTLLLCCYFGGRVELWDQLRRILERLDPDGLTVASISLEPLGDPGHASRDAVSRLDVQIAKLAHQPNMPTIVRIALAGAFIDRLPECRAALTTVANDGREGRAVASGLNAQILLAREAFWTGRWDEAKELVDFAVARSEAIGYALLAMPGIYTQGLLAAARGDRTEADRAAGELFGWASSRGATLVEHYGKHVRTLAASGAGELDDAYREAASISPAGKLRAFTPFALLVSFDLVEAAVRTDRVAEAAAHAAALQAVDVARLSSRQALLADAALALVAEDVRARGLFERALGRPGSDRWPFDRARVQLSYGERLRRMRAVKESRPHLRAAAETFARLRAPTWQRRAEEELRASGRTRAATTGYDREALTPRERRIVELAAAGLTNKEIGERISLSHRTVGFHLHRAFPKLGVTSRAALRDALAGQPDP